MSANDVLGAPTVVLKYFDLTGLKWAGRGGAVRLLLLAAGAKFEEEKVVFDASWPTVKAAIIASGENPTGQLPVVRVGDKNLTEHYAILRRFATQLGFYGKDLERDYAAEVIADAVLQFRDHVVSAVLGDDAAKENYKANQRPGHYKLLETLLAKFGGGENGHVVAGEGLTFADFIVFAQLWDDSRVFSTDLLQASPKLKAFFNGFIASSSAVAGWCVGISGGDATTASLQVA